MSKISISEKKRLQKEREEKNFKIALIIVCSSLFAVVAIFFGVRYLPDLIDEWKYKASLVEFTESADFITDEHGNKFYPTNRSVEAINTDKKYGSLGNVDYYLIRFMNEEGKTPLYIVENINQSAGTVLRLESAEDITLSNFDPISADICPASSKYPNDYFVAPDEYLNNGGNSRNDEKYIKMIFSSLTEGTELSAPTTQKTSTWIKLKSKKFPGLYYSVVFMLDENEIAYLYDVGSGKYVQAPDELTVRLS